MYDPFFVRVGERHQQLLEYGDDPRDRERHFRLQEFCQRQAFDILHDDANAVGGLKEREDRNDMRVLQPRQGFCLGLETIEEVRVACIVEVHHLDRDVPLEFGVARTVDNPHPSPPEDLLDLVGFDLLADHRVHTGPLSHASD